MKLLVIDTETSTYGKGNPFDARNNLVCISWWWEGTAYAARTSPKLLAYMQARIDEADIVIGFNFKFDYHWLRRYGLRLDHKRLWDCQTAEFILERQQNAYPSLEASCVKYELGHKLDIIKTDYWDKGINTDDIPWEVLKPYAIMDAELTYRLYLVQTGIVSPIQRRLLALHNQDLHVLQEMEYNGLLYDEKMCQTRAEELDEKIRIIKTNLASVYPDVPVSFSSGDNLSAFLYGGVVKEDSKEHIGFFKSGDRKGEPKYKNIVIEHQLPRMVEPLKGSELKKEGFYGTAEDVLKQLRGNKRAKELIGWILELSKLEKLNGTYYRGLPKLNKEMNWEPAKLHGNFNVCVTRTGRLSSSRPNLQNFASELQDVFVTRYSC